MAASLRISAGTATLSGLGEDFAVYTTLIVAVGTVVTLLDASGDSATVAAGVGVAAGAADGDAFLDRHEDVVVASCEEGGLPVAYFGGCWRV